VRCSLQFLGRCGLGLARAHAHAAPHGVSTGQKRFPEHNGLPRRGLLCSLLNQRLGTTHGGAGEARRAGGWVPDPPGQAGAPFHSTTKEQGAAAHLLVRRHFENKNNTAPQGHNLESDLGSSQSDQCRRQRGLRPGCLYVASAGLARRPCSRCNRCRRCAPVLALCSLAHLIPLVISCLSPDAAPPLARGRSQGGVRAPAPFGR
jgi:hypothetical protein